MENLIDRLVGGRPCFSMERSIGGLQATVFQKGSDRIVHLVNGVGQRPLTDNVPLYGLSFTLASEGKVKSVRPLIEETEITFRQEGNRVTVDIGDLKIWNAFLIVCEGEACRPLKEK